MPRLAATKPPAALEPPAAAVQSPAEVSAYKLPTPAETARPPRPAVDGGMQKI